MAFLSHSIPWHSLSSLFEYHPAKSGPGPQHADLFAKHNTNGRKQLEHFACAFQAIVREHSVNERKKYRSPEQYVARAGTWKTSDTSDQGNARESGPPGDATNHSDTPDAARRRRNEELRRLQSSLGGDWPADEQETRMVYPSDFANLYMSFVDLGSGTWYGRQGICEAFQDIDMWIGFSKRYEKRYAHPDEVTEGERNQVWLDEKSGSDIIRLLIIDAATTTDSQRRTDMLETVFLLVHHPEVTVGAAWGAGMDCCNINVGVGKLREDILTVFIFINLLWTYLDGAPDHQRLAPQTEVTIPEPGYMRASNLVPLLPRPAYMNTKCYDNALNNALHEHGHCVEAVFFNPLFSPYPSGRRSRYHNPPTLPPNREEKRHEKDVFSDLPVLKEALKSMWKILVYCEMLNVERGGRINWEYTAMDSISNTFRWTGGVNRLLGESWCNYSSDRWHDEGWSLLCKEKEEQALSTTQTGAETS